MTHILMPALSPTMEEGTLARWLVREGDRISVGDIIAEVETDKATMELEALEDGLLDAILVPAGSEGVKVGAPIAMLRAATAEAASAPAPVGALVEPGPPAPEALSPVAEPAPIAISPEPALVPLMAEPGKALASPLARRIAAQARLDLAHVDGSGPKGRILKADVEKALGRGVAPAASNPAVANREPPSLEAMGIPPGSYSLMPLDGMRKTIARRMTASFRDLPHFPLTIDIELDALLAARARINEQLALRSGKVSVNDFVIKAAANALAATPEANASYSPDGIAMHHNADIAVAVAIEGGLITPIIRSAQSKSLSTIAAEMKDLAQRAREKRLRPEEFQGGTFSISNLGMFGIKSFSSILNEPHGAIMSVGAADQRPVVRDGALAVATVMTITLTCDHRVLDGAIGARFLAAFRSAIEEPLLLI